MTDRLPTDRLRLRRWKDSDRFAFREMNADPEVMRFFPSTLTASESDALADRIEEEWRTRGWGLYAVEPAAGEEGAGEFAGFIGFHEATFESDFTPCVEIGWRLARWAWGRGLATEGAAECLAAGFRIHQFDSIVSFAPLLNRPSLSVMRKIGLEPEREFNHPSLQPGHRLCRHALYRIDRPRS